MGTKLGILWDCLGAKKAHATECSTKSFAMINHIFIQKAFVIVHLSDEKLRVHSFGVIWIKTSDPRSLTDT